MPFRRHTPKALEDFSVKLLQDIKPLSIADALAPTKKVGKISDLYYRYNRDELYLRQSTIRADKAPARDVALVRLTTSVYTLRNHALRATVSDTERGNSDPAVDPDMDAMEEITDGLLRDKEIDAALNFYTSTVYATNLLTLSTNAYDRNTTTSTPIEDSRTAYRTILRGTGLPANNLSIGFNTLQVLQDHADVLDRVKWSERGVITQDILASVLGIDKVNVSKVVFNDSREGLAASMTFVFNAALLYHYNTPNPKLRSGNLGVTFSGFYGDAMPAVKRYRLEEISSDVVELNWMYQQTVVNSLAGYFIAVAHA